MTNKEAVGFFKMAVASKDLPEHWREYLAVVIAELDRQYTTEPPTVPGWYWFKVVNRDLEIIRIIDDDGYIRCEGYGETQPDEMGSGEWCGPLTPPE